MEFSSILFVVYFVPLFLISYYATPKRYRNYTFLIWSIFFYAWGGPVFIGLMLFLCVVNFYSVSFLHKTQNPKTKKQLLWLILFANLASLLYFKYSNFFVDNVQSFQSFFGLDLVQWNQVALPIGISFFTFQSITYVVDVYKNEHAPVTRLSDYMLYILSFPQMIAGPIVQFNQVADQLTKRKENVDDFLDGFLRFAIGLGKKVLIANLLAEHVDPILGQHQIASTQMLWVAMIGYSFQIYFDFSGYSDMAVGLGKMVGFHFPENFNNPYTAKSISEFWRKWHMTLGSWMKNYLYIPLGGNQSKSAFRVYFNLSFVFLISGLWHGASWNFVLWGAFHGLFLILDRLFLEKQLKKLGILAVLVTFFIVTMGWVLFRMDTLTEAGIVYARLFDFSSISFDYELPNSFITIFVLASFFSLFSLIGIGKRIQHYFYGGQVRNGFSSFALVALTGILILLSIAFLAPGGINPFIYTRF